MVAPEEGNGKPSAEDITSAISQLAVAAAMAQGARAETLARGSWMPRWSAMSAKDRKRILCTTRFLLPSLLAAPAGAPQHTALRLAHRIHAAHTLASLELDRRRGVRSRADCRAWPGERVTQRAGYLGAAAALMRRGWW